MSFGQPSQFGVLNSSQNAPNSAFGRSASISAPQAAATGPAEVLLGDEIQEADSNIIGYVALAGELKVKVFEGQYPESDLPIPSSTLLAISQKRQLFAAGGPQGVVVARTSTLRAAFKNTSAANGNNIPFQPECVIPMSLRLSHVAFTSDGNYLLLAAQLGGIAVYSVDEILSKGSGVQPQSQIRTDPLLEIKPIPTSADAEKVCILVGSGWGQGGTVGIVDVKTQQVQGNLKSGVTTVSWSPKGKQIVCGGSGGGLAWIKPDGSEADSVPGVPNHSNHFVSSIYWIETNIVFVIVAPKLQPGGQHDNEAIHFVLIREGRKHTFYKVNDMTPPFGMVSRPTYHSFLHMKGWAPDMKDCLVLSNTCSTDIGTVMRLSNTPFTPLTISSDGRRATLPLSAENVDTTPIGIALDLTATDTERLDNPFPNIERAATALPCTWVLTNEGAISAYWVVYADAIKMENSTAAYPELLAYEGQQPPQTPLRTTAPAFGQPAFGSQPASSAFGAQSSTFGSQAKPAFGQPSTPTSTFGQPSKPTAFGQTSAPTSTFGQPSQPTSAFGQPASTTSAFGQTSAPTSAFGQPSKPTSAFGQPSPLQSGFGQTSSMQPKFGQSAFGSTSTLGRPGMSVAPFGSATGTTSTFGSGTTFGSQSGTSGFGALAQKPAASAFGSPTPMGTAAPAFGSTSALGGNRTAPAFGQSSFGSAQPTGTGFGQTSQLGANRPGFGAASSVGGGGGFSKFASGGGFLSGNSNSNAPAAFLQSSGSSNAFANKQSESFGSSKNEGLAPAFGSTAGGGFKMASAFGATATPDTNKTIGTSASGTGAFGTAFGSSLGTALSQPASSVNVKDDEMQDSDDETEQPRQGVRGGTMFNVGSTFGSNTSTTPAKDPPKALAPAFGQSSPSITSPGGHQSEAPKASAFGTGLFGSTLNKDQPKSAFGPTAKPTLAAAFGSPEKKPESAVVSPTDGKTIGTGLFGSALQKSNSGSQPVSAFSPTGPANNPISAFGKPSAFGQNTAAATKTPVSAFGQSFKPSITSANKPLETSQPGTASAANKGLPDDDSDNETDHSPDAAEEAPLPPDFINKPKKIEPVVDDAPLPPDFVTKTKKPEALVDDAPLPPDFVTTKPTKDSLPASNPATPQAAPKSPKKPLPTERSSILETDSPTKSPSKPTVSASPVTSPADVRKPAGSKPVNPLLARKGSVPTAKAKGGAMSSANRPSPQKTVEEVRTKPKKLIGNAISEGQKFFTPTAGSKSSIQGAASIFSSGISSKPVQAFSFATPANAPSEDDSDEFSDEEESNPEDEEDEGTGEDAGTDEEESSNERSSDLGDGEDSWIKDGDTDEGSPVQQTTRGFAGTGALPSKPSQNSLFGRISGSGTPKGNQFATKDGDVSKPATKRTPLPSMMSNAVTPQELAVLSPRSAARKKQEEDDKRRAEDEKKRIEEMKRRAEQEAMEKKRIAAEAQAQVEALRRQQAAEIANMNSMEKAMRDNESTYRETLLRPFEISSGLRALIPYRESGPFTNFKGNDGILEHLIITLERRIDNFGMNMRNLEAFVAFNQKSDHFTLVDPRPVEKISITATPDVSLMAKDLIEKSREFNKTFDLDAIKAEVMVLINEVDYLRARASDIPNIILLHTHPDLRSHIRKRPLAAQQRMQQASLRRKVPLLRRRVKRAEDEFRVLQAHVATINKHQKANFGDVRPPTIEQVRETVARLTDVAKEKAERLDNLEETLRKLRIRSVSPALSRGTTPSFSRAGSVSFSTAGRGDRERSGTPGWKSTRKGKDAVPSTPPRNMPAPDNFEYYEHTVDSPISRFSASKQNTSKAHRSHPGMFGLIEEELGDDEYLNDQNASSTKSVPIATSYDRGMAELRKEILTTPKKGEGASEIPTTPASRQVNRLLKGEMEEITGGKGVTKAWMGADDYAEDKKFRRDVGRRMAKVVNKVGVRTVKVSPV